MLWSLTAWLIWQRTPRAWTGARNLLLRGFGARIGRGVTIDPSTRIEIPWHLSISDHVRICEGAILYCLGQVTIGRGTLIGPFAHLCAGTHDYTSPEFTLLRPPITVGENCVLLSASFVAPGVTVAPGCIVRERASIHRSTDPYTVYQGNPAEAIGPRPDAKAAGDS